MFTFQETMDVLAYDEPTATSAQGHTKSLLLLCIPILCFVYQETMEVIAWLRCRSTSDPLVQTEMQLLKQEEEEERGNTEFAIRGICE